MGDRGWIVLALLGVSGCGSGAFVCGTNPDCVSAGVQGRCEDNGFCSFPDGACESGWAYGELAGGALAGDCVEPGAGSGSDSSSDSAGSTSGGSTTSNGPTTAPTSTTASTTSMPAECGNGLVEPGEACDGPEFPQTGCGNLGFDGGVVVCAADCTLDISGCTRCGDGIAEGDEECDAQPPGGERCEDYGFFAGELGCDAGCQVDVSACTNCGNDEVDDGELCDGPTLGGVACTDIGHAPGSLECDGNCSTFDVDACGGLQCGSDANAALGPCPEQCGSCNSDVCTLDCNGTSECDSQEIVCPPGWGCKVECDGTSACADADVQCPSHYSCLVQCSGTTACDGLDMSCSDDGQCGLDCISGTSVCEGAHVECGGDACRTICDPGGVGAPPTISCGPSCNCTDCTAP